ncbi:zinc ribbon domain-containing protein [Enterococcus faecium]|uniref:zinc ribbon domain-containing protein n=1 Tax=Enterococcus faecium TaxID=1352 RepID=UPI003512CBFE
MKRLQYKTDWYRCEIIKIDKCFPSSPICSECGHNDDKKPLKIKESSCPICHTHHDRDNNASIDILTERLRMQALV